MTTPRRTRREEFERAFYRFRQNKLAVIGLEIIIFIGFITTFAEFITPYPADATGALHFAQRLQPPSLAHPFGTDDAGDDVLTRVIFGGRVDLSAAILAEAVVLIVGIPLGMIAGYLKGKVGDAIMTTSDIFITIPQLVLALTAISFFTPSITIAILAVSLAGWPWYSRVIEAVVVHVREEKYIEASRMIGKKAHRIIFQDIFPNITSIVIVKASLDTAFFILIISALGFLGVGAQPPTPSWGAALGIARADLPGVWWTSTFPGIFIFIAVLGFTLLGDGLNDALDVRLQ